MLPRPTLLREPCSELGPHRSLLLHFSLHLLCLLLKLSSLAGARQGEAGLGPAQVCDHLTEKVHSSQPLPGLGHLGDMVAPPTWSCLLPALPSPAPSSSPSASAGGGRSAMRSARALRTTSPASAEAAVAQRSLLTPVPPGSGVTGYPGPPNRYPESPRPWAHTCPHSP